MALGKYLLNKPLVQTPRFYEVGWQIPFLVAFISPGRHSLLGGGLYESQISGAEGERSTHSCYRVCTSQNPTKDADAMIY